MQKTMLSEVFIWSVWQPDRNIFFNSHFIKSSDGNCIVDPLPLSDGDAAEIDAHGGAAWVILTNRDHERDAERVARRFGAKIAAAAPDAEAMSVAVDRLLSDGDSIASAQVIRLDGLKTSGEFALFFKAHSMLVVGDALWGDPMGSVRLMPDDKLIDPALSVLSLCKLRAFCPKHLLLGDGSSIFNTAFDAISACLDARPGVLSNRINIDELSFTLDLDSPPGYLSRTAEIGWRIGASKLGYQAVLIPPGEGFCPTHHHTAEEELFIVWDGSPTLFTPRGETQLRRGDCIAILTGDRGTHKLINASAAPCTIVAIANADPLDVCFYPDSKKILIQKTGTLVRSEPELVFF
jgi:uncharacterized cupin superfamily protein/glyoxylase-like metal-dependent hydrolase (beta-lactamase superfamily II)